MRALGRELRSSVSIGSDSALLTALTGNSDAGQGANTWQGFMDDVAKLLRLVGLGAMSRPFFIVTPEVGKVIAAQSMVAGIDSLAWNGGMLAAVPFLVSDAQTPDRITLVDAAGLAIALGPIELRSSEDADIEMNDTPTQTSATPTASTLVSMFATNSRCLKAERSFSVKAIRNGAYAHLTGLEIGGTGGSPTFP